MTEAMSLVQEHLLHLPEHRVLICRHCEFVIRPMSRGVRRHLLETHKNFSLELCKISAKYTSHLNLLPLEEVLCPAAGLGPVEGLSVLDGWQYNDCGYGCVKEDSKEYHCKTEHRWLTGLGKRWEGCKVQTFFASDKCKYFVIASGTEEEGTSSTIDHFIHTLLFIVVV